MSTGILSDTKAHHYLVSGLEPKQRIYVDARAQGTPPVASARIAGFADPEAKAMVLEQDLTIRSAIEYTVRIASHKLQLTKNDVINGMLDAVRLASTAAEVTGAWREIGKLIGAYEPVRVETNVNVTITREKIAQLSDEELAKMAAIDGEFVVLEDKTNNEEGEQSGVPEGE